MNVIQTEDTALTVFILDSEKEYGEVMSRVLISASNGQTPIYLECFDVYPEIFSDPLKIGDDRKVIFVSVGKQSDSELVENLLDRHFPDRDN